MAQGMSEDSTFAPEPFVEGYQIQSVIGNGGMGTVYLATQLGLNRPVAIKQMSLELQDDPVFLERLEREAQTMAALNHENIVTIHQFEKTEADDSVIIMEYVEGGNLRDLLTAHPNGLPLDTALRLTRQIASALSAAHQSGVVHRDLKPENVLITSDGRACLSDFGLAVPIDQQSTRLTLSGTTVGTLDYLAPERFHSTEADARSDLFALGVILYEMLIGQVPRGSFDPPDQLRPDIPKALNDACIRALRPKPEDRFSSLDEFLAVLSQKEKSKIPRRWFLPPIGAAIAYGIWKAFPGPPSEPTATDETNEWFDALSAVDLERDIVSGNWIKEDDHLVSDQEICVLSLDPVPATPYEIRTTFTRLTGVHSIAIFLTLNNTVGTVDIDGWGEGLSGLENIGFRDLRDPDVNHFLFFIENNRRYELKVRALHDRVLIWIDGEEMGTFETKGKELSITQPWKDALYGAKPKLGIGSFKSSTRFEKVEWRTLP